jgi:hypothetical protein
MAMIVMRTISALPITAMPIKSVTSMKRSAHLIALDKVNAFSMILKELSSARARMVT